MPLALSRMGILLGTFVILWSGLTAGFGLYLQTKCARYLDRGGASFFALSQITYPKAAVVFDAAIAIKCFGVGISYLIIIGDLMPGVVQAFDLDFNNSRLQILLDRHFWVTAFMLVVIPLSFLRRLDSLKYTSVIALISISYLVILVVAHYARGDTVAAPASLRIIHWHSAISTLSSFPVMVFAYTCHQNMFSVLNEIGNNSHFRTTALVAASIGTAAFIYILVAITGYLSFGADISGNIVALYNPSVTATIGKAAIVVLVMFSYPLQVHPCRASLDAVLKWRPSSASLPSRSNSPSSRPRIVSNGNAKQDNISATRFAAITTAIILLSYIVAMTVSSLEHVLAYVGSTGSTSISFILPGLFYYKISSPDSPLHQRLLKADDDGDANDADGSGHEEQGLLSGRGSGSGIGRRKSLRRLSLGLAGYGFLVMVTTLITNTWFVVAPH